MSTKTTISNPGRSDQNEVSRKNTQSGTQEQHTKSAQPNQKDLSGNKHDKASVDLDHNVSTKRSSSQ